MDPHASQAENQKGNEEALPGRCTKMRGIARKREQSHKPRTVLHSTAMAIYHGDTVSSLEGKFYLVLSVKESIEIRIRHFGTKFYSK